MRKLGTLTAVFGLLVLLVMPAVAMHHEVKIVEAAGVGKYLTDAEGMTLYWFKMDSPNKSACTGDCVGNWPLFFRAKVAPPPGLTADEFGTITREDGGKQTTFRGYPLYYYKGDSKAGESKGNNMMDIWFLVDPGNFPLK